MKKITHKRVNMEDFKRNKEKDKDIIFSKAIRAGKRIYYIDVKKNKKGEMYLAVTESKRIFSGDSEIPSVNFEKHKIFLYQEDFEHFTTGLNEAIGFIRDTQKDEKPREDSHSGEIKIDIDF